MAPDIVSELVVATLDVVLHTAPAATNFTLSLADKPEPMIVTAVAVLGKMLEGLKDDAYSVDAECVAGVVSERRKMEGG